MSNQHGTLDALCRIPLTPREKVADRGPAGAVMDALWPILGGDQMDAETWTEISMAVGTALASGSGDHAELASECVRGLQSIEDRICESDPFRFTEGTIYAKSIRALEALLAENAALRAENTEAERKLAEADRAARKIVDLKIPPGDDPEQRLKLLSLLAKAQVLARTFLSKEAPDA